jgi:hypothetical protein
MVDVNIVRNEVITAAKAASDSLYGKYGTDHWGACGFAWITVYPVNKGNTKAGKAERKILEQLGFRKDWTGRAYEMWNPSGYAGQNINIKEAGADAGAEVLRKYGFKAYSQSRLD